MTLRRHGRRPSTGSNAGVWTDDAADDHDQTQINKNRPVHPERPVIQIFEVKSLQRQLTGLTQATGEVPRGF